MFPNWVKFGSAHKFAIIGVCATLTHLLVGNLAILSGVAPLKANFIAFLVAFFVSFFGHYHYSFAGHSQSLVVSLLRFGVTAICGFLVNQLVLWGLLTVFDMQGNFALILSTVFSAATTYFMSKLWAFRTNGKYCQ